MMESNSTTLSWTSTTDSYNSTESQSLAGTGFADHEWIPLWIPYVILTIFLLGLVVVSFVRFHRKRISQNRQRLEAIADKLEKEREASVMLAANRNGQAPVDSEVSGVHPAASELSYPMSGMTSPSSTRVPTYLDLFLSFTETMPSPRKNGETMTARAGQNPTTGRSNPGDGGGMARVVSMVAAGKRLARTVRSPKGRQPTRSFRFNDNGSMVDLQCEDHASTFQCGGGTLSEDPQPVIPQVSRFPWRRQRDGEECWSMNSGDWAGIASPRPPIAERLLAPIDGDRKSFRMWTPTPADELRSTHYEMTLLKR